MAKTFEDNLARLEEIVAALEKGDLEAIGAGLCSLRQKSVK